MPGLCCCPLRQTNVCARCDIHNHRPMARRPESPCLSKRYLRQPPRKRTGRSIGIGGRNLWPFRGGGTAEGGRPDFRTPRKLFSRPQIKNWNSHGQARTCSTPPAAPADLTPAMTRWWDHVVKEYDLEPHRLHLLMLAARAFDRCEQARLAIAKDGTTYLTGSARPGPAPRLRSSGTRDLPSCAS
jgi:hypothetical protein